MFNGTASVDSEGKEKDLEAENRLFSFTKSTILLFTIFFFCPLKVENFSFIFTDLQVDSAHLSAISSIGVWLCRYIPSLDVKIGIDVLPANLPLLPVREMP